MGKIKSTFENLKCINGWKLLNWIRNLKQGNEVKGSIFRAEVSKFAGRWIRQKTHATKGSYLFWPCSLRVLCYISPSILWAKPPVQALRNTCQTVFWNKTGELLCFNPDYALACNFLIFCHLLASLFFSPKERLLGEKQEVSPQFLFLVHNLGLLRLIKQPLFWFKIHFQILNIPFKSFQSFLGNPANCEWVVVFKFFLNIHIASFFQLGNGGT